MYVLKKRLTAGRADATVALMLRNTFAYWYWFFSAQLVPVR
jgi:hypothetical protein